ncbi:MAG: YbaN family protein [Dehalococcoidales bacterium]|nr:YbaN family protein [Dehalococcoidales bacterium]
MSDELKKRLLTITGTICLVIGVIGIFIPILPTTPFLLLAAACYLRSSPRFHSWLMNNRLLGTYIRNYTEGRGIPIKVKLFTIALLWVTIGISIGVAAPNLIVKIILAVIAIGVTLHIIFIRARKQS